MLLKTIMGVITLPFLLVLHQLTNCINLIVYSDEQNKEIET